MKKVYRIIPGSEPIEITTIKDLPNIDEEVQLLIEDIDEAPLSYSNGERYIYGGDNSKDRWICVQGVKCWYTGKALENLKDGEEDNGFVSEINIGTQEQPRKVLTWSNTLLSNDIKNNLYHSFTMTITNNNVDSSHTFSVGLKTENNNLIITLEDDDGVDRANKKISLEENFQYLGLLPVVSAIDEQNKLVTFYIAFVALTPQGTPIIFQTTNNANSWIDTSRNNTQGMYINLHNGGAFSYKAKFATQEVDGKQVDYELYYALGLTDIYKKKTLQDVEEILSSSDNNE